MRRRPRRSSTVARALIGEAAGQPSDQRGLPVRRLRSTRARQHCAACGYPQVFTSDRRRAQHGDWLQPRYSVRRNDTFALSAKTSLRHGRCGSGCVAQQRLAKAWR